MKGSVAILKKVEIELETKIETKVKEEVKKQVKKEVKGVKKRIKKKPTTSVMPSIEDMETGTIRGIIDNISSSSGSELSENEIIERS